MDFSKTKSANQDMIRKSVKFVFLLIFDDFFWFILYFPGFCSSLRDKKQRNGSIYNISEKLIYIYKKSHQQIQHVRLHFWKNNNILKVLSFLWLDSHRSDQKSDTWDNAGLRRFLKFHNGNKWWLSHGVASITGNLIAGFS